MKSSNSSQAANKTIKKSSVKRTATKSRVRSVAKHRSFRLSKKKLKQHAPVPGTLTLLKKTITSVKNNKRLFIGIGLINLLVSVIFIQGLSASLNINEVKQSIEEGFGGEVSPLTTSFSLFAYLIGTSGTTSNQSSAAFQFFLVLITSLAIIWGIRQVQAGEKPRMRDSYYNGMYPLIPFLLVLFVIGLQLVPFLIGNLIYATVIQNGLAITIIEKILWLLLFLVLFLLSAYMLTSSLFALYIVTLPQMTPMKALRSARELVLHRRFSIGLRLIALPLLLLITMMLIFVPLLLVAPTIAQILFLLVISMCLVLVHIYIYLLYRALI